MKFLNYKNYGSIGHLPGSKLGDGDHSMSKGQSSILTEKVRDYKDLIIVQEKVDGANVGIVRHENNLIGVTRKGWKALDSDMEQFKMFQQWINYNENLFYFLREGERLIGEWIAMAHGTRYICTHPFIAFDLMTDQVRAPYIEFRSRIGKNIPFAHLLHIGGAISIKQIEKKLTNVGSSVTHGFHGALDQVEGAVWRVEREGKVDFLAKYVRQNFMPGKYFAENHNDLTWNWK